MVTKFPAEIDTSITLPTAVNNLTPVNGAAFNRLRDAIIAVETALGTVPGGQSGTVKARLNSLESEINSLEVLSLSGDLGGTINSPTVIGIHGRPITSVAPSINDSLIWDGIAWINSSTAISNINKPLSNFIYCDKDTVSDLADQNGSILTPFASLSDAVDSASIGDTIEISIDNYSSDGYVSLNNMSVRAASINLDSKAYLRATVTIAGMNNTAFSYNNLYGIVIPYYFTGHLYADSCSLQTINCLELSLVHCYFGTIYENPSVVCTKFTARESSLTGVFKTNDLVGLITLCEIGSTFTFEFTGSAGVLEVDTYTYSRMKAVGISTVVNGTISVINEMKFANQQQGSVIYYNGTTWVQLAPSTDGYVLTTHSTGLNPTWDVPSLSSASIANNSVTFIKMQDISTNTLIGRDTVGTGDPEEISISGGLEFTGSSGIRRSAISGDITIAAGSNVAAITSGVIVNSDINTGAGISISKLQNVVATSLVGNSGLFADSPSEITLNSTLSFSGSTLQRSAISGDITIAAGSNVSAITSGVIVNSDINSSAAVSYSKLNLSNSIVNADINSSAAINISKLAPGSSNNIISTLSGVASWVTLSSLFGSNVAIQKFTAANGTYTPNAKMSTVLCILSGGGGGGGGATTNGIGQSVGAASGGQAASTIFKLYTKSDIGASKTYVIGQGGAGGSTSGTNGSSGGSSTFHTSLVSGGAGGLGISASDIANRREALRATPSGNDEDIFLHGAPGGAGIAFGDGANFYCANSGEGGDSFWGGGGVGRAITSTSVNADNTLPGNNGSGFGSGGSGAICCTTSTGSAGGDGRDGVLFCIEFLTP